MRRAQNNTHLRDSSGNRVKTVCWLLYLKRYELMLLRKWCTAKHPPYWPTLEQHLYGCCLLLLGMMNGYVGLVMWSYVELFTMSVSPVENCLILVSRNVWPFKHGCPQAIICVSVSMGHFIWHSHSLVVVLKCRCLNVCKTYDQPFVYARRVVLCYGASFPSVR